MRIKFSWGTGWMEIEAKHVIEDMLMTKYRQWVKLFARYGQADQHQEFMQLVNSYIDEQTSEYEKIKLELEEMQMKFDGRIPTLMSSSYLKGQVRLLQKHLNGAESKLKRYKTIYQVLEGLIS